MADPANSSRVRPAALPYWEKLQAALISMVPDCEGDDRYVADPSHLPESDRTSMARICSLCPLYDACADYATVDAPTGGWWPGLNLHQERNPA